MNVQRDLHFSKLSRCCRLRFYVSNIVAIATFVERAFIQDAAYIQGVIKLHSLCSLSDSFTIVSTVAQTVQYSIQYICTAILVYSVPRMSIRKGTYLNLPEFLNTRLLRDIFQSIREKQEIVLLNY